MPPKTQVILFFKIPINILLIKLNQYKHINYSVF